MTPVLYNDARQFLFIWTFIFAITAPLVFHILRKKLQLVNFALFILITLTLADSISLSQYNYLYRNIFAQNVGIEKFESDYWAISGKNLVQNTSPAIVDKKVTNYTAGPINSISNFMPFTAKVSQEKPFIYFELANSINVRDQFPECNVITKEYAKQIFSEKVLLSYAKRCER
jgi:hypothetical protein